MTLALPSGLSADQRAAIATAATAPDEITCSGDSCDTLDTKTTPCSTRSTVVAAGATTTLIGNLTREPELRYTRDGQATTTLGVAVNRRWQDRTTQEWQESTSFFDVTCWRDLAENVALSLTKGMRVVVTGRLEQRTWETEEGEHRSKVEITADEVGASLRFATAEVHKVERRGSASPENAEADAEAMAVEA